MLLSYQITGNNKNVFPSPLTDLLQNMAAESNQIKQCGSELVVTRWCTTIDASLNLDGENDVIQYEAEASELLAGSDVAEEYENVAVVPLLLPKKLRGHLCSATCCIYRKGALFHIYFFSLR